MASLDELEVTLRAAIVGNGLALSAEVADAVGFPKLPPWLGDLHALTLEMPVLSRPPGMLLLTGALEWPRLGSVALAVEVVLEDGSPSAKVRWVLTEAPSFASLCASLELSLIEEAARFLERVRVQAIRIQDAATGDLAVSLEVAGAVETGFGGAALRLALTGAAFAAGGTVLTQVRGTASFGSLALPLVVGLSGGFHISVAAPDLSLADVASALDISLPPLPPLPLITQPLQELRFALEPPVRLSARTPLGELGTLTMVIAETGAGLLLAAGLDPSPDFRFSSLSPALRPLDLLLEVVRFGAPAFTLSTGAGSLPYLNAAGEWVEVEVTEGVSLRGAIALDGLGLELLHALLGLDQLPFALPIGADLEGVRLRASLPVEIEPLPGLLKVRNLAVTAAVQPFSLSAEGVAEIHLFGARLPDLVLGVTLGAAAPALYLKAAEPWRHPAGLPVDIEELGLQLSSPPPAYAAFGKIRLRDRTLEAAAQFVGEAPSMLVAEATGAIALQDLILEMVGLSNPLPDFFSPTLHDPSVYIVVNPAGATIAGRSYPAGLGISGRAGYLGLELSLRASATPARLSGEGGLSRPVSMGGLLEITGPGGQGAPHFQFDSAGSPVVAFGGRVSILGIAQDVAGEVAAEGVRLNLEQQVGPVEARFAALLGEGRFQAEGVCQFGLAASIGPLQVGPASLGRIRLDTRFAADTRIAIRDNDVQMTVSGSFSVMGIAIALPTLAVSPRTLADLPAEVLRFVSEHAEALFAELLRADTWLRAIAEKVVEEVENVARELKEHFEQTAEQIARGLHDVLHYSTEQTAQALKSVGESAENTARALGALGEPVEQVAKAMIAVGYAPALVGEAFKALGHPAETVRNVLNAAGVGAQQAQDIVEGIFRTITQPPHIKVPLPQLPPLPHIKVAPHLKVRW